MEGARGRAPPVYWWCVSAHKAHGVVLLTGVQWVVVSLLELASDPVLILWPSERVVTEW